MFKSLTLQNDFSINDANESQHNDRGCLWMIFHNLYVTFQKNKDRKPPYSAATRKYGGVVYETALIRFILRF